MRIRRRREESEELPLTPLIDVVFLLLIFFLTATSFYKKEKDIKVDPPTATEAKAVAHKSREITVNVRSAEQGGILVVNQEVYDVPRLTALLTNRAKGDPRQVVIIRGDKHAYHQRIVDVLNACKKARITNYYIATTVEEGGSP